MKALMLEIELLEPLILARPGAGEENSAIGQDYIPGSTMLGIAANAYLRENNIDDPADDIAFRRLFLDGSTCFLNAYMNMRGERSLPKPLSWFTSKDDASKEEAEIFDFAISPNDNIENATQVNGSYCLDDDDEGCVYISSPKFSTFVHNMSMDRNMKSEGKSTVYRYRALSLGQAFSGAVISDEQSDLEVIDSLLGGKWFKMGTSRSAGYGLVYINTKMIDEFEEYTQDQYGEADGIITVTLLSDAIIVNDRGQNSVNAFDIFNVKPKAAYYSPKIVSGFNRKWGLPLPQAYAFKAGSVFVYNADELDEDTFKKASESGIGQRRSEGFGRIAVNWHLEESLQKKSLVEENIRYREQKLSVKSSKMVESILERLWRDALDEKLGSIISSGSSKITAAEVASSQLQRLRAVAHEMWFEKSDEKLKEYMANLKKPAKSQIESAKVGSKSLYQWLEDDFLKYNAWDNWEILKKRFEIGGVKLSDEALEELKIEYNARLLDKMLRRTLKDGDGR